MLDGTSRLPYRLPASKSLLPGLPPPWLRGLLPPRSLIADLHAVQILLPKTLCEVELSPVAIPPPSRHLPGQLSETETRSTPRKNPREGPRCSSGAPSLSAKDKAPRKPPQSFSPHHLARTPRLRPSAHLFRVISPAPGTGASSRRC